MGFRTLAGRAKNSVLCSRDQPAQFLGVSDNGHLVHHDDIALGRKSELLVIYLYIQTSLANDSKLLLQRLNRFVH